MMENPSIIIYKVKQQEYIDEKMDSVSGFSTYQFMIFQLKKQLLQVRYQI